MRVTQRINAIEHAAAYVLFTISLPRGSTGWIFDTAHDMGTTTKHITNYFLGKQCERKCMAALTLDCNLRNAIKKVYNTYQRLFPAT